MKLKQKLAISYIRARLNILSLVSPAAAAAKAFTIFCTPFQRPGKKASSLFEKGEKLSFKLEGQSIRGHRWLPHQASSATLKKVLIVHGFESSSRNFDQYVSGLLKKGYEVLAFDAPGHGASGGKRITLPLYVKMLRHVTTQYGPVQSFMGHSLGALALVLLLESIRQEEDTRLVLIAPVCEMVTAVDAFFHTLHLNKEVRAAFDDQVVTLGGHPFSWYSMRRALPGVRASIRWIQDENDLITPVSGTLSIRKEGYPNIEFIITKGLGHRKIYRDPGVIRQILEFL